MSDRHKDFERQHLLLFLSARESATGQKLTILSEHDGAPDFLCVRPAGEVVGIEHTRFAYDPRLKIHDDELDNWGVLLTSLHAIAKKEVKRKKSHWIRADATILVLDLVQGERWEKWPDDADLSDEFSDAGFVEIWISDHRTIEAYGEVELIGLYPKAIWGVQGQGHLGRPPYK